MFLHRPAMKFCVPLIAGILVGWSFSISPVVAALIVLSLLLCLVSLRSLHVLTPIILFVVIFSVGIFAVTVDWKSPGPESIQSFAGIKDTIRLCGHISDDPVVAKTSIRFSVDAESIEVGPAMYACS